MPNRPQGHRHFREEGRLWARLEAARNGLEAAKDVIRERRDLRSDIERAGTKLEEATAWASPRFQ